MGKLFFNNKEIGQIILQKYEEIVTLIIENTSLNCNEFYLMQNGKRISTSNDEIDGSRDVYCVLRVCGGKGGFGSMLRAIGAQIEKTTNREACRDLSGRRLRDINEEKRLKAWLEKQGEREREAEERKKRKIEKLLAVPKHEFKDEKYEEARSKLTEKVSDAVEEGFKKVQHEKGEISVQKAGLKRQRQIVKGPKDKKKKQQVLWIGDDISSSDDENSSDDDPVSLGTAKTIPKISEEIDLQKPVEVIKDITIPADFNNANSEHVTNEKL